MRLAVLLCGLLSACRVVDAPEALEDVVVYGFVNFEDDERLAASAAEIIVHVNQRWDEVHAGYRVDDLSAQDLREAGVDPGEGVSIVGAFGAVDYEHDIPDLVEIYTRHDKDEIYDDVPYYEVISETDRDCFLARTCNRFEQVVNETITVAVLGDASRTYTNQYAWVYLPHEQPVLAIRTLTPDPMTFSTNIVAVEQQYAFVVLQSYTCHGRRAEAFWADAEFLGLDVPDATLVDMTIDQMEGQAQSVDDAIDSL